MESKLMLFAGSFHTLISENEFVKLGRSGNITTGVL